MDFILDSDILIKYTQINALFCLSNSFSLFTTKEVKEEVVRQGKKIDPRSSQKIEKAFLEQRIIIRKTSPYVALPSYDLGRGELSLWKLGRENKNATIISDDKEFLAELEKDKLSYLNSAQFIEHSVQEQKMSTSQALIYLEKLAPLTSPPFIERAREKIQKM